MQAAFIRRRQREEMTVTSCNSRIAIFILLWMIVVFVIPSSLGYTYEQDVYAINNLFAALGSPILPGWVSNGGDPCMQEWQGVACVFSNITEIVLPGANLGGHLGDSLHNFTTLIKIDLSNNHIGGNIPPNLPSSIQHIFLSGNQFTGSIPGTLWMLGLLEALSLNKNNLTGHIPDSFQALTYLENLDLSYNDLSGELPQSLRSLSSLATLYLENNQLTGTLDVLQVLPLSELNVENNLLSGPVPVKLFNIPNFRMSGNFFNTSETPSPLPPRGPEPSSTIAPYPTSPMSSPNSHLSSSRCAKGDLHSYCAPKFWTVRKIVAAAFVGLILICVAVLLIGFFASYSQKSEDDMISKIQEFHCSKRSKEVPSIGDNLKQLAVQTKKAQPLNQIAEASRDVRPLYEDVASTADNGINMIDRCQPSVFQPVGEVTTSQIGDSKTVVKANILARVKPFSVAYLQQYTGSFSQEYLVGGGNLGNVYRAGIPGGRVLAIKKLNISSSILQSDESFMEFVSYIANLYHENIVKLEGYCVEHGQRLLIYEFCSKGTLYDALHSVRSKELPWDIRLHIAVGIARALEFLHEHCKPPVVHGNLSSVNVLLDEKLCALVSDCGLSHLLAGGFARELSGCWHSRGYSDPSGTESNISSFDDIYGFGVILLELFTGRKPYDTLRNRGEHYLAEWASHQLHDIESLQNMIDTSLCATCSLECMSKFADIISLCLQVDLKFRPPVSEIIQKLQVLITSRNQHGDASRL